MFPPTTPTQPGASPEGLPPPPLSPQPTVTPQAGPLAPGAPVEFELTPPPPLPPPAASPMASEAPHVAPPAPSTPPVTSAAPRMMTTKEAEELLGVLFERGEYAKVVEGAEDILATEPDNAEARALRDDAQAAIADPVAAKKRRAAARRKRTLRRAGITVGVLALLGALGVAGWVYYGEQLVAPPAPPPTTAYTLSIKTDPVDLQGPAPFTVTFDLRNADLPQGVTVLFSVGDGVSSMPPFTQTFEQPGSYEVTAVASAADGTELDRATRTVTVLGPALEVNIASVVGQDGRTVSFTSTVTGAEGELQFAWSFGDGTDASDPNPVHAYEAPGTYEVLLLVTTEGTEGRASTAVTIGDTELPSDPPAPTGAVDADITTIPRSPDGRTLNGTAPMTVYFSSGGSASENGALASFHWNFGDSFDATQPSVIHSYDRPGLYRVVLTVTDEAGVTGTESLTVHVTEATATAPATGPVAARIESDVRPAGTVPFAITFDGSSSSAEAGPVASYEWDFGDGSTLGTGAIASHIYQAPGRYTVTLTITDATGREGEERLTVTVS